MLTIDFEQALFSGHWPKRSQLSLGWRFSLVVFSRGAGCQILDLSLKKRGQILPRLKAESQVSRSLLQYSRSLQKKETDYEN